MPGRSLLRSTLLHKTLMACLLLAPIAVAPYSAADDWKYEETHTDAREFVAGGMLHVHLTVGDVHVRRSDSARIHLTYTVKSRQEKNVKDAQVDFQVRGNDAFIEFHTPFGGNTQFDVDLEVPASTNLDVHQKVGDLTVEDIDGDKDLSLGVGDIRVGKAESHYRVVHASAGIGDVHSDGYGETSGWLGKTLRYHGEGKYELRAHVGVGDITLPGK